MSKPDTTPEPTLDSWRLLAIEQGKIIARMSTALTDVRKAVDLIDAGASPCEVRAALLSSFEHSARNELARREAINNAH